jgi:GDP-D-mannose dehydratase
LLDNRHNRSGWDAIYVDPHDYGARFRLHYGDMTEGTGLRHTLEKVMPDEVYTLAAQYHVRVSFGQPEYTADAVAAGTLRLLEAVRDYCGDFREGGEDLPGSVFGDVRRCRAAAERSHAVLSAQPLRRE